MKAIGLADEKLWAASATNQSAQFNSTGPLMEQKNAPFSPGTPV